MTGTHEPVTECSRELALGPSEAGFLAEFIERHRFSSESPPLFEQIDVGGFRDALGEFVGKGRKAAFEERAENPGAGLGLPLVDGNRLTHVETLQGGLPGCPTAGQLGEHCRQTEVRPPPGVAWFKGRVMGEEEEANPQAAATRTPTGTAVDRRRLPSPHHRLRVRLFFSMQAPRASAESAPARRVVRCRPRPDRGRRRCEGGVYALHRILHRNAEALLPALEPRPRDGPSPNGVFPHPRGPERGALLPLTAPLAWRYLHPSRCNEAPPPGERP